MNLVKPVYATSAAESWLHSLVNGMKSSLKQLLRRSLYSLEMNSIDKVLPAFPAQVSLLLLQIWWTRTCEYALSRAKRDKNIMQQTNANITSVLNNLVGMTSQDLNKLDRIKYETLVVSSLLQEI
jgi:dynein heavy chain